MASGLWGVHITFLDDLYKVTSASKLLSAKYRHPNCRVGNMGMPRLSAVYLPMLVNGSFSIRLEESSTIASKIGISHAVVMVGPRKLEIMACSCMPSISISRVPPTFSVVPSHYHNADHRNNHDCAAVRPCDDWKLSTTSSLIDRV